MRIFERSSCSSKCWTMRAKIDISAKLRKNTVICYDITKRICLGLIRTKLSRFRTISSSKKLKSARCNSSKSCYITLNTSMVNATNSSAEQHGMLEFATQSTVTSSTRSLNLSITLKLPRKTNSKNLTSSSRLSTPKASKKSSHSLPYRSVHR